MHLNVADGARLLTCRLIKANDRRALSILQLFFHLHFNNKFQGNTRRTTYSPQTKIMISRHPKMFAARLIVAVQ